MIKKWLWVMKDRRTSDNWVTIQHLSEEAALKMSPSHEVVGRVQESLVEIKEPRTMKIAIYSRTDGSAWRCQFFADRPYPMHGWDFVRSVDVEVMV